MRTQVVQAEHYDEFWDGYFQSLDIHPLTKLEMSAPDINRDVKLLIAAVKAEPQIYICDCPCECTTEVEGRGEFCDDCTPPGKGRNAKISYHLINGERFKHNQSWGEFIWKSKRYKSQPN
jgi:hypothetical protein